MPDTIRPLAELNALFGDSDVPTITPQHERDLQVSTMPCGEIGSGVKSAITLPAGFTPLDFTVAGVWSFGFTVDTVNKWIADTPCFMRAEVSLDVQFQGANGIAYDFAVFKNPDTTPEQIARLDLTERIINVNQRGAVNVSAFIALNAGDKLQAGVRSSGATFTLLRGALRVKRLGIA